MSDSGDRSTPPQDFADPVPQPTAPVVAPTPAPPRTLAEARCLVVDDDGFARALLRRLLETLGIASVAVAADGAEALATLTEAVPPDVILCDLNMPGMDGVEFLRHLVERHYRGAVILISGEDKRVLQTARTLGEAQDLTILGALSKPVTAAALAALLAGLGTAAAPHKSRPRVTVAADDLADALARDRLTVHFQPKVSVVDGRVRGVETLVRWIDPDRGMIPPDAFIPVAETAGLIDQLTETVFRLAMAQAGIWAGRGLDLSVAINLSVDNLTRLDLPEAIVATARAAGVNPHKVVLEITESRLMADVVKPLEILTRLRLKGLEISIDDFGTGHSSMEQLQRIPFTELKIDRSFVHGAARDDTAASILASSVSLARKLGLTIVAEGVEDQDDWDLVARLGIDLVQGYFVSRPLAAADFDAWLATRG